MLHLLFSLLIVFSTILLPVTMQEDGVCDPVGQAALAEDFLHHWREIDAGHSALTSSTDRLDLLGQYVSFLLACRAPLSCDTLRQIYADRLRTATTGDDLAIISADFTTDVILCRQTHPLIAAFRALGFDCTLVSADSSTAEFQCKGENTQKAARRLLEAARESQAQLAQFSITLADDDSETRYIFTGSEWLIEPHFAP